MATAVVLLPANSSTRAPASAVPLMLGLAGNAVSAVVVMTGAAAVVSTTMASALLERAPTLPAASNSEARKV